MNFKVNKTDYEEDYSESMMNISQLISEPSSIARLWVNSMFDKGLHSPDMLRLSMEKGYSIEKKLLKEVFGRQLRCVVYCGRYWVWTFSRDAATVYLLAGINGVSVEFDKNGNFEKTIALYFDVVEYMKSKLRKLE